jgi:hypothetical protein
VPVANEVPALKTKDVKMCPVTTTEERQKKNQSNGRMEINKRKLKKLQVSLHFRTVSEYLRQSLKKRDKRTV